MRGGKKNNFKVVFRQSGLKKNQGWKKHAFVSQYGDVRKVEPPPVGPRDSVLYG